MVLMGRVHFLWGWRATQLTLVFLLGYFWVAHYLEIVRTLPLLFALQNRRCLPAGVLESLNYHY